MAIKRKCKHPKWKGYGRISGVFFSTIKRAAKKRGIEFNLSVKYLWELFESQKGRCALSGLKLSLPKNSRSDRSCSASLDRIDSNKGYVIGNVQWTDKRVNIMKHSLSEKEFIRLCKRIIKNTSLD